MKILHLSLAVPAVLMILGSCSKGAINNGEIEHKSERITVTLPASCPIRWQSGEQITIIGSSSNTFSILPGFSETEASFEGQTVGGYSFKIIHPGTITSITGVENHDFTTAVQSVNGSMDHIKYVASLDNAKSYHDISFTPEWAEANGATLRQSSILKLTVTLPAGTLKATKLSLSTKEPLFFTTNSSGSASTEFSIGLNNMDLSESEELVTYLEMPALPVTIPSDTELSIYVETPDAGYLHVHTLSSELKISGGHIAELKIETEKWDNIGGRYMSGTGTESDPYVIGSAKQIKNMIEDASLESCTYFKLAADIDMASIKDWTPINAQAGFKKKIFFYGDNHTIYNFSCSQTKYPSFFGVLNGTVQNLTFDGVTLNETEKDSSIGTIGGFSGTNNIQAIVRNVTVKNVKIQTKGLSIGSGSGFGAVAGQTQGEENNFFGVRVSGFTINSTDHSNLPRNIGGFIGYVRGSGTYRDCHVENVSIVGSRCLGGFVGYERAGTQIYEKCSAKDITITSNLNAAENAYIAGFCGCFNGNGAVVRDCHVEEFSFTDNAFCKAVGGFIGQSYGTVNESIGHGPQVIRCSASKSIIGKTNVGVGGLIGIITSNSIVEDCWADVDINAGNVEMVGGLIGGFNGTTADERIVRRCLALGSISGGNAVGGLIGLLLASDSATDTQHTVESCIAWNPLVESMRTADDLPSSGAIIGSAGLKNTLTNNMRNPAMTFKDHNESVYDQDNTNDSKPLDAQHYTKHFAYHGKAAAADATLSSVAQSLGWSADVWDFSKDIPVLK